MKCIDPSATSHEPHPSVARFVPSTVPLGTNLGIGSVPPQGTWGDSRVGKPTTGPLARVVWSQERGAAVAAASVCATKPSLPFVVAEPEFFSPCSLSVRRKEQRGGRVAGCNTPARWIKKVETETKNTQTHTTPAPSSRLCWIFSSVISPQITPRKTRLHFVRSLFRLPSN